MTDNLKETLSALIDGEASEIEIHRLLRQFGSGEDLKPSWVSYLQLRSVVRGENVLSASQHLSLHDRISRVISDEEQVYDEQPALRPSAPVKRYVGPAAGLAVAASLVVAVFVSFNLQQGSSTEPVVAGDTGQPAAIETRPVSTTPSDAMYVDNQSPEAGELRELDEERQRQLRSYLNQHDRMVRMNPNVRTVGFEQKDGK